MALLNKLNQARQLIKKADLKKVGRNEYSKYDYFTPEQVNKLVNDACQEVNLFNKFDLLRSELGLIAELTIFDIETGDSLKFKIATEIPQITATNIAQQLGGAVTYSERYLLMIAYDIKDNNLDFDSHKPKEEVKQEPEKPILKDQSFDKVMQAMNDPKPTMVGSLTFQDNNAILNYVQSKYIINSPELKKLKELC